MHHTLHTHGVAKETIARHFVANNTRESMSGVNADSDLNVQLSHMSFAVWNGNILTRLNCTINFQSIPSTWVGRGEGGRGHYFKNGACEQHSLTFSIL